MTGSRGPGPAPRISVVVTHYRQPEGLRRVLAALDAQRGVRGPVQIVVADDGSTPAPRVPEHVALVSQPDEGFRASAARHLGAGCCRGEVLVFLDADTVPEPDFLAVMQDAVTARPHTLAVGRRRYARFSDRAETTPDDTVERGDPTTGVVDRRVDSGGDLPGSGAPAGLTVLPDPAWPAQMYRDTDDLTDDSDGIWRGVLSCAMAVSRRMYDTIGGFDPDFVGYGGEDWDLGWRAVQAGARLRHVPEAVAWHDGPDWSGRGDDDRRTEQKNRETLRLAGTIASALTRPAHVVQTLPRVAVDLYCDHSWPAGSAAATCAALLAWEDVAVAVHGDSSGDCAEMFAADPRVHVLPDRPRADAEDAGRSGDDDAGRGQPGFAALWRLDDPAVGGPLRRLPEVLLRLTAPMLLGPQIEGRVRELFDRGAEVTLLAGDREVGRAVSVARRSRELLWEGGRSRAELRVPAGAQLPDGPVRLERIVGGW